MMWGRIRSCFSGVWRKETTFVGGGQDSAGGPDKWLTHAVPEHTTSSILC